MTTLFWYHPGIPTVKPGARFAALEAAGTRICGFRAKSDETGRKGLPSDHIPIQS